MVATSLAAATAPSQLEADAGASPPPRLSARTLFWNPYVAFIACVCIGAAATWLFPEVWLVRPGLAEYPVLSRLVYVGMLAATIVASHRASARGLELLNITFGLATMIMLTGWKVSGLLVGFTLFTYFVSCRLPMAAGVALTFVGIFGCAYAIPFIGGFQAPFGLHGMKGIPFVLGFGAARLLYYVYERPSIPKAKHSLSSAAAHAFGVILWTGPLLSYITYTTKKPDRQELTSLGVAQLYRSAAKMMIWALGGLLLMRMVPELVRFDLLRLDEKILAIISIYVMFWARISASFDLSTATANLCGYYAPNALDNFFASLNPLQAFRRHDVHSATFILRIGGYPLARKFRNHFLRIVALSVGAWICRSTIFDAGFAFFYGKNAFKNILGMNGAFHPLEWEFGLWWVVIMVVSHYSEEAAKKIPRLKILWWTLCQTMLIWFVFTAYWGDGMTMRRPANVKLTDAQRDCYWSMLWSPGKACPPVPPPPATK